MTSRRSLQIFYVGNFKFPDGDAGSHRVYGIGKALRGSGYRVVFLGAEYIGRPQDAQKGNRFVYDDFSYYPAGCPGESPVQKAFRLWHVYISGLSILARLKALWTDDSIAVLAYQASSPLLARLRSFCKQRQAFMVADVVEWYDRRHVPGGQFGPFALDSEFRMRYWHKRVDGIMAISNLLKNYYGSDGIPVIKIPPLIDIRKDFQDPIIDKRQKEEKLQLVFAGKAGKKDLLTNAILGLGLMGRRSKDIRMKVVGPSRLEVLESLGSQAQVADRLNGSLQFIGSVSHAEALGHLRRADFSILLRPDLRFAHAGFPTKLVESLAMGIPVICNLTGDIGSYVRDEEDSLIVPDSSPEAFASGLERALLLSKEQKTFMRNNARRKAEVSFDFRNWIGPVGEFMHRFQGSHSLSKQGKMRC